MISRKNKRRKNVPKDAALDHESKKAIHKSAGEVAPEERISWRFALILDEPHYGWPVDRDERDRILESLKRFEAMTVNEIFSQGKYSPCKTYQNPADIPNPEANKRFMRKYDDRDELHRLHCTGPRRLFGFRRGSVFSLLWWDPNHEIWPSSKR